MNKLQKKSQSSKLNITKKKLEKITKIERKSDYKNWSFTLGSSDSNNLQELLEKVNSLSQRKVNFSQLIRALIYLGKTSKEDKLLKALKEITV